ncbi:chain-length determining protein [Neptunomonas japonica]|uniref:Capsular polysaccharide transport system permease protein n=1 Tax=Neptunomonas japonica JAMM 1380 TaxID=1441457 RepID=A0A7R6PAJ3_9GAMM|nr:chain-length determining protein [Neptunomonas japonica]BBB30258.1 capsular polysaccharide transport system permease protein [Neptunomonas japonica JAMM 1380]
MTIKHIFKQYPHWLVCFVAVLLVTVYWSILASDSYVSQSNVVLESPQVTVPNMDVSALLGGNSGDSDMLLLRDYLLSVDMLRKIDTALGFRAHYASSDIDYFTRLRSSDVPIEELHEYYLKQVSVELDDYAQILRINVSALTPEMAHAMTSLLLSEGETHMNRMGQRLADEQVKFLETQVAGLSLNFQSTRNKLIEYQNENGLVSPAGTVESLSAVVAGLEVELANLQAKQTMLTSYQSSRSPSVVRGGDEIKAIRQQIKQERARMAQQSGGALNTLSAEYQTLELKVEFAMESYSGALAALESTRIEAARKLKQVSVLQSPTLPEYPVEPKRVHNIVVFTVIALFLSLIVHMLVLIVRDHRD